MTTRRSGLQQLNFVVAHEKGSGRRMARFTCDSCGDTLDIPDSTGHTPPAQIATKAIAAGWDADHRAGRRCRCPKCKGSKARATTPTPTPPPKAPELPMALTLPAPLTSDQRVAIREALAMHFDDGLGAYVGDMDDESLARQVGVPRVHVETIRETAFGPIRITAAQKEAQRQIAALQAELAVVTGEVEAAKATIAAAEGLVNDLRARADALAGQIGRKAA